MIEKIRCTIDRDMRSKRLNIIVHVFGFLILSVGILYLCQFMSTKINEGFQSIDCPSITQDGRKIYLCDNQVQVDSALASDTSPFSSSNDNICISTTTFGNNYYTCYDRPPGQVYDSNFGVYRDVNPLIDDDPTPSMIAPNIDGACLAFNVNTIESIKAIRSTMYVRDIVNTAIVQITGYVTSLNAIYTNKCSPAANSNLSNLCDGANGIKATRDFFQALPASNYDVRTGVNNPLLKYSLNTLSNTVRDSLNSLSNISANIVYNSFNGMNCDTNKKFAIGNI